MRDPTVGDQVDQYRLTELLARSGMASIFKGIDTESGTPIALKIPHVQYESDIVFSERFRREEESGQKLDHPNIVRILKPTRKSRTYLAMEFVEGRSLRTLLGTPLSSTDALRIAAQLCDALEYLHQQGVVHRDMKPENVLLSADGTVKILDFGIALFASERRLTWTGFSHAIGTPDYMAPEQIRGRRGDPRTDVYAVGTMLYEMLTGHLPYDSANPRALLRAKTTEEPRPPSYYVPDFDPSLEAILLKALERDPRHRYLSAGQLLVDLRNPSAVAPRDPQLSASRRTGRGVSNGSFFIAGVVVIILGLAVLIVLARPAPPRREPSTPAGR